MSANFTRRRDLFSDAGFKEVDPILADLARELHDLPLSAEWKESGQKEIGRLRQGLAQRLERVPRDQLRLARLVPEWLTGRSGDLTTALWLAKKEHGDGLDLCGFLFAIFDALLATPVERDALAFARFALDLEFNWSKVYGDQSLAYQFLREREPNPFVWQILDEMGHREQKLRILELGCGLGNDAFGFLHSPLTEAYCGIDLADAAVEGFKKRLSESSAPVMPNIVRGDFTEVLANGRGLSPRPNLIYSYSSLHYFSSGELRRLLCLAHQLLSLERTSDGIGFFAFAIKGAGSIWHEQGIPLYRPDVWINWDGQSRWFPSKTALVRELDRAGFEVRFHELHDHWNYSEMGKRDVFHYVLCSPRT